MTWAFRFDRVSRYISRHRIILKLIISLVLCFNYDRLVTPLSIKNWNDKRNNYALRIDTYSATKPAEKGHGGGVVAIQGVVDSHRPGATVQFGHQSEVLLYAL